MALSSEIVSRSTKKPRSHCPISFGLDLVGDRWTLLVLRDLIIVGKRHFRELTSSPEAIASNILTARLNLLECQGIITRRRDPTNARQLIYEPTAKGLDLLPVMLELARWGATYDPKTAAPPGFAEKIRTDRDGFIDQIRSARGDKSRTDGKRR